MSIPQALVAVRLTKIRQLPNLSGTQRPYVVSSIGGFVMGRSRSIPTTASEFDLTVEPSSWSYEGAITGDVVPIIIWIRDDLGDVGSCEVAKVSFDLPYRTSSGTLTFGSNPEVECEVHVRLLPPKTTAYAVPRTQQGSTSQARIALTNQLVVELTAIEGLYKPGHLPTGVTHPKRSEPLDGYISEDHEGRIFINSDLTRTWKKKQQYINLHARVTARTGVIPGDAQIHWIITIPDNPFNTPPWVHRESGFMIDPKDYNRSGEQTGFVGDDNADTEWASARRKRLLGRRKQPWEEVPGFALSNTSATKAKTAVVAGESQVTLHCPHSAGDRLMVKAEVVSKRTPITSFGVQTGIMTMWCRIDVEYRRMPGALALPVDRVSELFEPYYIELDFMPEQKAPDCNPLAASEDMLDICASSYVNKNFRHKKDPGWFCLISAKKALPMTSASYEEATPIYSGKAEIDHDSENRAYFKIFGDWSAGRIVTLSSNKLDFRVYKSDVVSYASAPLTRLYVFGHDMTRDFTSGDGSLAHAYRDIQDYQLVHRVHERLKSRFPQGGYNLPTTVDVKVFSQNLGSVAGISPEVSRMGKRYFAGRTIVFTHHPAYYDPQTGSARSEFDTNVPYSVIHEFVHAFGLPHKCGRFDYRTPRDKTCLMNYQNHWMVDDSYNVIPDSENSIGEYLCALHLREMMRTKLEDNLGLSWR